MTYDMTSFENASTLLDLFTGINTATGGLFATLTMITLFVVIFFTMQRNNPIPETLVAASLPCAIVAFTFYYGGVTTTPVFIVLFTVTMSIGGIALYKSNSV